jgi:hypothetical protein
MLILSAAILHIERPSGPRRPLTDLREAAIFTPHHSNLAAESWNDQVEEAGRRHGRSLDGATARTSRAQSGRQYSAS